MILFSHVRGVSAWWQASWPMTNRTGIAAVISAADAIFHAHPSSAMKPHHPRTYGTIEIVKSVTPLSVDLARARSSKFARTSLTEGSSMSDGATGVTSGVGDEIKDIGF